MGQACDTARTGDQMDDTTKFQFTGYREMNIQEPDLSKGPMGPTTGRIYVIGGFGGRDANHPYEWNDPDVRPSGQPVPKADDYLDTVEAFDGTVPHWVLRAAAPRDTAVLITPRQLGGQNATSGAGAAYPRPNALHWDDWSTLCMSWARSDPNGGVYVPGWRKMRPLSGRRSAACAVSYGGAIYLMGGFDGTGCSNMTNKWEPRRPMIHKRSGAGAAVGEKHIYMCGGWDGTDQMKSVERYNILEDKWEEISEMHYERSRGLGSAFFGGFLWAMGGMDKNGRALNSVERYDPHDASIGSWEIKMQMCERRCSCATAVLRDNLYVMGGFDGKDALSTVERYDALNDRWCNVSDLGYQGEPNKRSWLAATTFNGDGALCCVCWNSQMVTSGRIYVLGGHDNHQPHYSCEEDKEQSKEIEGHNLASVECFIPEKNRWEQLAPMSVTRSSMCCVALDDGYSA